MTEINELYTYPYDKMISLDNNHDPLSHPMVSIIMTTFNAERYLGDSIRSALDQSIGDLEIICVDGGSTDRTCDIIQSLMEDDPRIKLFRQTRPGIGAAKNNGIEFSSGKYITFLDADDYYVDKEALRMMYDACEEHNVKICGALRTTINKEGFVEKDPLHRPDCEKRPNGILLDYRQKQYDYHFHSYLYNRDMILQGDARFAEVSAYDDTHFFIRAMLAAKRFYVIPVELYRYRIGPEYDWGPEKAMDAIDMLTDQLIITKKNKLAKLHWITVQRINYEYCRIFYNNVRNGCNAMMDKLIKANDAVDAELLDFVEDNHLIDRYYLKTMMHRPLSETKLIINTDDDYKTKYILEPLWMIKHGERPKVKRNIFQRAILCVRDNGLLYTIKIAPRILSTRKKE